MYNMFVCGFATANLIWTAALLPSPRVLPARVLIDDIQTGLYPQWITLFIAALKNRIFTKQPFHDY